MATRRQKIQRIGNSAGILLPKSWLAGNRLKPGARVRVDISPERIAIFPEPGDREVVVDRAFARQVEESLRQNRELLKRLSR